MFSGPHQTPFVCATPGNAAGMGLPPIPQSPTCETPTVVSFVYRNLAGAFLPYDPAAPPPAVVDRDDDDDGREDRADDPPLGARRDQPVHVLDHDALARLADRDAGPLGLEPEGALQLLRRRRDRAHAGRRVGRRHALPRRPADGLRRPLLERQPHEHALQPPARRRDGDHGQGPLRLGLRGAGVHDRRRRLRRRDPAVRLRPEPSRPARRRRAAVLVPRHGHADDPRRRLRAARALGRLEGDREPALDVADVGEPVADRGVELLGDVPEPVRGRDAVHARARLDRVHQRLARPLAAGAQPALRHRARVHAWRRSGRSSGRTGATS